MSSLLIDGGHRLEGTVAGITYRIQEGDGPPLVLLPLGLASSHGIRWYRISARGVGPSR